MKEELHRKLPPGIDGNHTGTLTICFRQCSVPNVVGNIKFWGGEGYNVAPGSSIDYTLVGERTTIATYLQDASPLHIKILTRDRNSVLIGNVFIPDLSLPTDSLDCSRSSKGVISLRQKIIGDATFELHFQLMPVQMQQPHPQHINDLLEQASDSECQVSELCRSAIGQEKYSLITELLDICSDDMTIPTVDTSIVAATGVDPFDSWISNIISSAASPPASSTNDNETVPVCEKPIENATAAATAATASSSETFPHPIALFLSNVATAAKATQARSCSTTQSETRVKTAVPPKLEPMQPPPIWIDVGVYCISNLRVAVTGSPPCCLELNLMCNEPMLSLCDLVQCSAFRGDERSKYSSENVTIVEMPDECKELVSLTTQISWQAGLKTLNGDIEITLQIRCRCNDETVIIGNVSIPLQCKQMLGSLGTLDLLPRFEANGWFDILDNSRASIGRIQLSMASGTLKQIRSLPKAHKCAAAIQRYWREMRSRVSCNAFVGKENEATKSDEGLSEPKRTRISLQNENDDDDEDTVDSHPPPPPANSDDGSAKQMKQLHAESSPDSLFEEWSQQSSLHHVDANEKEVPDANDVRVVEKPIPGGNLRAGLEDEQNYDPQNTPESKVKRKESTSSPGAAAAAAAADEDVRVNGMDEGGSEWNATLNPNPPMNESAVDAAELADPFRSSHVQLDSHHHSPSNEDESTPPQRRQPIDPPEEYDVPNIKRKMDDQSPSSSVRDAKRHRAANTSTATVLSGTCPSASESQMPLSSDLQTGAVDMSVDEEDSSEGDCRSLQSVMNSLADVEERLKCDKSNESNSADVAVDDRLELTLHSVQSVKSSTSQPPLETGSSTKTPAVETCEKGTSPLCIPNQCKDASTSPCEEEGRNKVHSEEEEDGRTDDRDNENNNRDRSTSQLNWSLNNDLTRNNSTQGQSLFSTLRTSSDRRGRYSSLFNTQHSPLRLGSLLSPTGGAARMEGSGVDSSGYKRYLIGRRKSPDERVSSLNFASTNSDRIEQIFRSGNKKKKED